MKKSLFLLVLAMLIAAGLTQSPSSAPSALAQSPELLDLQDLDTLRDRFNADRGHPRLILLLSPT